MYNEDGSLDYDIDDIITFHPPGGGVRTVIVNERDPDIKGGRPGFSGENDEGCWWGYDDTIIKVVKHG